uniref:POTRA domain-containing protein n=1 Tax=uncultured Alphaproteobacteria bacterium TaxID=91750 RepID=A0A6G8F1Y3_9PROT|nr:hypothetical protein PlAlph_0480 [uncultured Alphaproteobacteria bacterium]
MWFRKKNIKPEISAPQIDENLRVSLPRLWPYRLIGNLFLLGLTASAALGIYIVKTNFVGQKLTSVSDYLIDFTTKIGFTVDDILVYGRTKTPMEEVNNVINLHRGDNIFSPDIHQLRNDLEQLPWVKSARIERSYMPNIIKIGLTERRVQAIWQINGRFYPVDTEGRVINTEQLPRIPLLLIVGAGAPEHLNELLAVVKSDDNLYKRIKAANFISERRWNIILDDIEDGITIKLPAQDIAAAWKKLIKLNQTRGLLKRKLTIIDLRFDNKILVTPRKLPSTERLSMHGKQEHGI